MKSVPRTWPAASRSSSTWKICGLRKKMAGTVTVQDVTNAVLDELKTAETFNTIELADRLKLDHQKIVGAIKSLQCLDQEVITCEQSTCKKLTLTKEGEEIVVNGSHEASLYHSIPEEGITQSQLMKSVPNAKIGFSKAMSSGWIRIDKKAEGGPKVTKKVPKINDVVRECLVKLQNLNLDEISAAQISEFKKRKLVHEITLKSLNVRKGVDFGADISKQETDLTAEMIASGSWKTKSFKSYNMDALGTAPPSGHLHPLLKVRTQFRQIFLEMGFSEMPTNNFIESSFWNFDALFQPQQHPARDEHDTFFMSEPQNAKLEEIPEKYLEAVKRVHSEGGYGSQGYKYDWKIEEARKNILRTHTTAVSSRMLHRLAQEGFKPAKYFSIDRVFRNETLDATHLAEFHQIEGVVADYNLTLGHLMGTLQEFFRKLGIEQLRFKPAYNPYTEPSMEVFSYHKGLDKWVEIGNSGVFRPEMLRPMGLPEDVSVIAWGLSLERPTMIKYGINNIRDLVGHKVNLQMVYDNPLCRLEKS